ncbi:ATP-dependent DNA helicase RecG [candidate division WWE3 bacterium]|nr:ATP-dependent DNA helicase RecG [candidate division WWE3 bacterium]
MNLHWHAREGIITRLVAFSRSGPVVQHEIFRRRKPLRSAACGKLPHKYTILSLPHRFKHHPRQSIILQMKLDDKVTKVPQVGPKSKEKLANLKIETIKDLLYHFPFRYEDRSKIENIQNVLKSHQNGKDTQNPVTIKAKLTKIKNIYTKNCKRLTRAAAQDETGEIQLIWFNMHYLKRSLRVGETYLISGKVGTFSGKTSLIVPQMEKEQVTNLHIGRIVPIYHQTEGISSRWLRSRINDVLAGVEEEKFGGLVEEFLPEKLLEKYAHLVLGEALKQIHFPDDFDLLEKARARLGYNELFHELVRVEKVKQKWELQHNPVEIDFDEGILEDFVEKLPFRLTNEQIVAVEEILEDFREGAAGLPMNRLLEGDVGTGKTVVAIVAALANLESGRNVLYMAPTEILARQHFATFAKFLPEKWRPYLQLVTGDSPRRGLSPERTVLSKDSPLITIGTHALLYKKQKYKNVGLVIIDEQHRFGVEQREKLLSYNSDKTTPHLLTMTATPIPRTLALTLYGDLEISTLTEKPRKEAKIITKVVPNSKRKEIFKWIAAKNEPTFIVCPFVEESTHPAFADVKAATTEYETLKKGALKGKKVGVLHGQLSSQEKQKVVEKFEKGKLDVLVSTPVIEVGIDIPDATVMVIESAERFGLASLHQLRGRVGRGKKDGYCFVFASSEEKERGESNAIKRLKNLEKFEDGLSLAEIDLKMRGPGEIYGVEQHGFKNFKIADLSDINLIENVKKDVKMYLESFQG